MDNINFYAYLRVSTTRQDFLRQTDTISKWESKTNITIPKENYFVDYYTGKNFDRKNYQELKSKLKEMMQNTEISKDMISEKLYEKISWF